MYELALTQSIVDLVTRCGRQEGLHRVTRVVVKVGVAAASAAHARAIGLVQPQCRPRLRPDPDRMPTLRSRLGGVVPVEYVHVAFSDRCVSTRDPVSRKTVLGSRPSTATAPCLPPSPPLGALRMTAHPPGRRVRRPFS